MAYAVGLRFDEEAEKRVTEIWRELANIGLITALFLDGYVPHVSLTLSETLQLEPFVEEIGELLQAIPKLQLQFSSVSLFTNPDSVLIYGVTPTEALLQLHGRSHKIYQRHASNLNLLYQPGTWVPHCGLAIRISEDKLKTSIDIARTISLPYAVPSVEYVIVEHDGRRAQILYSFPLSS